MVFEVDSHASGSSLPERGQPPLGDAGGASAAGGGGAVPEFARYRILREIARGAYGVVYLAHDPELGREVALKVLLAGAQASQEMLRGFRQEAQAAARLRHPGIVPIHDIGVHEGKPYFTMDFIEGRDLGREIPERMGTARIVRILREIAEAVQYAHEQGIVHRDLKPGNVLISAAGRAFVTDFGLARDCSVAHSLSQAGDVVGTPLYMSPEQAQGKVAETDERSDIYSLGAILYEMLTGRPPFQGHNWMTLLAEVIQRDPLPPRLLDRRIGRELESIVLKCLEKDPARRYRSAGALAEDLRRYAEGEPVLARKAGLLYRARKYLARHRWRVASFGVAWLALLLLGGWQTKLYLDAWAGWELIYSDDFQEERLNWAWLPKGGRWQPRNGVLDGSARTDGYLLLNRPIPGDVRITFDACCLETPEFGTLEAGVLCNASGEHLDLDGYFGSLGDQHGVKLQRRQANVEIDPRHKPLPGRWYHLRLERVGWELLWYLDGEPVARLSDPVPITGGKGRNLVGLYLFNAHTRFDNFRVYARGAALTVSVLETGNVLFDRGYYDDAAKVYRGIQNTRPGTTEELIAAYREALCYIELAKIEKQGMVERAEPLAQELFVRAELCLEGVRDRAAVPWRQFAQAALAEVAYTRGHYLEAISVATQGAGDDRVLRDAVRALLSRYQSLRRQGQERAAKLFRQEYLRLYGQESVEPAPQTPVAPNRGAP